MTNLTKITVRWASMTPVLDEKGNMVYREGAQEPKVGPRVEVMDCLLTPYSLVDNERGVLWVSVTKIKVGNETINIPVYAVLDHGVKPTENSLFSTESIPSQWIDAMTAQLLPGTAAIAYMSLVKAK